MNSPTVFLWRFLNLERRGRIMKKLVLFFISIFVITNIGLATTINLKWDGESVVPTSCTYGGTFAPPVPDARPGYVFVGWKVKNITPSLSYTELEYIQSSGVQYIDTGLTTAAGTTEIKVVSDVIFPSVSNSVNTSNGSRIFCISEPNAGLQVYLNGGYIRNQATAAVAVQANTRYVIETVTTASIRNITVNGYTQTQYFSRSITDNAPIYTLGSPLWGKTNDGGIVAKIYSQKFYINSNLVRDFIPVKDSNNIPCLYDKVTGQFFYSETNNGFVAGPEI